MSRYRTLLYGVMLMGYGLTVTPHVVAANCPYPADYYRQKAQETRQSAARESAINTQRDYHQAAARAYNNAAAQYDAKYQECLGGRSGGGGMENSSPGFGGGSSNNGLQNFYNQMNQYQSQEADRQRRQSDHEEFGRMREQQGENRAESERLRQLHDAEMQQEIDRLARKENATQEVLNRFEEQTLGKKPTAKDWADRFGQKGQVQGIPVDPNACVDIEYTGKGQAICHAKAKDILTGGVPKEIEFPAPSQRLNSTDWSKRFGAPSSPPASSVSPPTSSPSALVDPQPAVPQNSPAPDWSKRFGTSRVPSMPEKGTSEEEVSDPDMNTKQSLRDRVSSKINSIKDTVSATADRVRQETSLKGMCQRSRASTLYSKSYSDLRPLEQRGIDVECAAVPVEKNATIKGRYEYGSGVVESGGKLLDEAGKEVGNTE